MTEQGLNPPNGDEEKLVLGPVSICKYIDGETRFDS